MKMMLCSRRHPDMDRTQFFHHLSNVHGPLVKSMPECTNYIRKYVQNHTRLPEDGISAATAFHHEQGRDSVIELWFDDKESMIKAASEPKYQSVVRPDEARFNDLAQLIIVAAKEVPLKQPSAEGTGTFKTFDFIKRRPDIDRDTFLDRWERHAETLLALDGYQQSVRQSSRNLILFQEKNVFGDASTYDGVVETWFASFEDADRLARWRNTNRAVLESEAQFIDAANSFSVLAEERPVIG